MVRNPRRERGFTLMELMIVLAILGGMVVLVTPYLSNRSTRIKGALRELTTLSREIHTKAKLQGATFRLVIDLKDPDSKSGAQTYWVERADKRVVLKPDEEELALQRDKESDEEKKKDPSGFTLDESILKEPKELPSGLRFDRVELTRSKNPITRGKAFIHYLPQGLVDETAIHLKGQDKEAWTIVIHPITGRAELVSRTLSLRDMGSK